MALKTHGTRTMRFQILGLGSESAIGSGKKKIIAKKGIKSRGVTRELRIAKARFVLDDLVIWWTAHHGSESVQVRAIHETKGKRAEIWVSP